MIVASYTRAAARLDDTIETAAVGRQNQAIAGYIKRRGWKLNVRFSDRKADKNAEDGFKQMKAAAINREFDCIVINSIGEFGRTMSHAFDTLEKIFLPAGIQFAVVKDNFYSGDHSKEECQEYLTNSRKEYRSLLSRKTALKNVTSRVYDKYGYLHVVKGNDYELVEDPATADVVRRIFAMAEKGMTTTQIAKILNQEGIDSPSDYLRKLRGKEIEKTMKWESKRVAMVLDCTLYLGVWERFVGDGIVEYQCPSLTTKESFYKIQEMKNGKKVDRGRVGNRNAYKTRIKNKETGEDLQMNIHPKGKYRLFRFRFPRTSRVAYSRMTIPYSEVEEGVKKLLLAERDKAKQAYDKIASGEAELIKRINIEQCRGKMQEIFHKEVMLETSHFTVLYGSPDEDDNYQAEFAAIHQELKDWSLRMDFVQEAFSVSNPWIELFMNLELPEELNYGDVKKYIELVEVEAFERIEIQCAQEKYREVFPTEWFAEV